MAEAGVEIFKARRVIALSNSSASSGAVPIVAREQASEGEAFAVLGERIVATGTANGLVSRFPSAALTDVGDGVIVPGFVDAHIHPSIVAEDILNLDVSSTAVRSLSELTGKVLDQAVATPPGTWLRGTRYDDAKMAEGRVLTRWALDERSEERRVGKECRSRWSP